MSGSRHAPQKIHPRREAGAFRFLRGWLDPLCGLDCVYPSTARLLVGQPHKLTLPSRTFGAPPGV